jgi:ubiquitin C-terminal hydrolase
VCSSLDSNLQDGASPVQFLPGAVKKYKLVASVNHKGSLKNGHYVGVNYFDTKSVVYNDSLVCTY